MKIQLIQQLAELDGGQFLEVFPGPYKGRSWNETSVYIEDNAFGIIEPIVKKHVPQFDNRANTAISAESWKAIIGDLKTLRSTLNTASSTNDLKGITPFRDATISGDFDASFQDNKQKLATMLDSFITWLERELGAQPVISVLGI